MEDEEIEHIRAHSEKIRASGRAVSSGVPGTALGDIALVPAPFLKDPKGIRDVAEWYVTTAVRQDYIHKVFEKQTAIALHNLERLNQGAGDCIDVVFVCGTDFGTQISTFCSADTFKEQGQSGRSNPFEV